jgi:hypothetical protein
MLEHIALIASVISAITAITTSLRALGVSRESSRTELEEQLHTASRIGHRGDSHPSSQRSSLRLHMVVTVVWFILSVLCSLPFTMDKMEGTGQGWLVLWGLSYFLLILIIFIIWRKVLRKR